MDQLSDDPRATPESVAENPFVTVRDEAATARVLPQSGLRLVLPLAMRSGDCARIQEITGAPDSIWSAEHAPQSMFRYATDIARSWTCKPLRLLRARGPVVRVAINLSPWRKAPRTLNARLADVGLWVYPSSAIALLTVTLQPDDEVALSDWLDLAAAVHHARGGRAVTMAIVSDALDNSVTPPWWIGDAPQGPIRDLFELVHERALGRPLQGGDDALFIRDRLLVSGSWFISGAPAARQALVRYAIRSQFSSSQLIGADEEIRTGRSGFRLPYALRQDFVSTLEATHYVGFDLPTKADFFRITLPQHLNDIYFPAWAFALQQRYFLLGEIATLADEALSPAPLSATERYAQVEGHAKALAQFEARGYALQLYHVEHHHRYWDCVRAGLDIDALHQHLTGLLHRAMTRADAQRAEELAKQDSDQRRAEAERERAERQAEKDRELELREKSQEDNKRVRSFEFRIIVALAVPGIIFGFAGINIRGWTAGADGSSWDVPLALLALSLAILAVLVWAGLRRTRRDSSN